MSGSYTDDESGFGNAFSRKRLSTQRKTRSSTVASGQMAAGCDAMEVCSTVANASSCTEPSAYTDNELGNALSIPIQNEQTASLANNLNLLIAVPSGFTKTLESAGSGSTVSNNSMNNIIPKNSPSSPNQLKTESCIQQSNSIMSRIDAQPCMDKNLNSIELDSIMTVDYKQHSQDTTSNTMLETISNDGSVINKSRRKRSRHRKNTTIVVSEGSDMDASEGDRSSPSRTVEKKREISKLVIGTSKVLGKGSDLPSEERPYHDFFPDLIIEQPMPILRYDTDRSDSLESIMTSSNEGINMACDPLQNDTTVCLSVMGHPSEITKGVCPPMTKTLPVLSMDAFKSVPTPSYTKLSNTDHLDKVVKPLAPYSRHIEPSEDDLAERVEYDMDEQDRIWLNMLNVERKRQGYCICTEDLFEAIIDHIEKEWFDLTKDFPKSGRDDTFYPEDISCAVCDDGEAENSNAIVFCDGCNLAVHQDCYGVPFIPEGQWLCRKCMLSPETPVSCLFCPIKGGAFKQTTTNKWVHLNCAMWIPECHIANTVYMEPVEGTGNIPKSRWRLICYICRKRYGAPIQCSNKACFVPFHASCARKAKLFMRMRGVHNNDPNNFRAYCDKHTPKEYRELVDVEATTHAAQMELFNVPIPSMIHQKRSMYGSNISDALDSDDDQSIALHTSTGPRKKKQLVHGSDTNRSDFSKSNASGTASSVCHNAGNQSSTVSHALSFPSTSSDITNRLQLCLATPVIPQYIFHQVLESTTSYSPRKKDELIGKIAKYWSLKRESRRGAALLKRLHLEPWTTTASAHKEDEEFKMKKYELLGVLRRDFERVRLLTELVRKREKEKERICKIQYEYFEKLLNPLASIFRPLLDQLKYIDRHKIFTFPVSKEDAPDYFDHVKSPMDYTTMTLKFDAFEYLTVDDFQADLDLVINNCLFYNKPNTVYSRAALRLKATLAPIMQDIRKRTACTLTDTGLLNTNVDHSDMIG
ncbi:hypothetical protein BDV3_002678 [Batrachochytrium dendrobatidis]